jgi:Raf kinase inhibitor-like YbhB/YbcL family protein
MRKIMIVSLFMALSGAAPSFAQTPPAGGPPLMLTVPAYPDGGQFPVQYSQAAPGVTNGGGTSPAMAWTNVPKGTQSFVLHMHDLNAALNKTTVDQLHWLVWPIPAAATGLPEGVPAGAKLADGSFQVSASGTFYRGPGAPANGPFHHYLIELYALDNVPDVQPAADPFETRTKVMAAIQGHIIGKAVYSALFHRPN